MAPDISGTGFKDRVYDIVAQIPEGRVMTYGQIAALAGSPRAARQVGGVAHFGPPGLPWQRVVNKSGGLAAGYWGGRDQHRADLESEGVVINDEMKVSNVNKLTWWPDSDLPI